MSSFIGLKYIPEDRPLKYDVTDKKHLKALYKILREAAADQLKEARLTYMHPEDIEIARDEYRVLDGAARAIRALMHKTPNAKVTGLAPAQENDK